MGATKRRSSLKGKPPARNKIPSANTSIQNIQAQNLARLALGHNLKRSAADLAVRSEPLARHARVNRRLKRLAAKRAADCPKNFHVQNLAAKKIISIFCIP
jgi:hypothetical protein